MKRLLISTAAVALMASSALAADLPVFEPVPEVVPVASVYDWSGFYVGLHVGGAFLTDEDDTELGYNGVIFTGPGNLCAPGLCPATLGHDEDDGFLAGGGHAGFQGQWGIWVAGIEADITYLDLDNDAFDDDDNDGRNGRLIKNPGTFGGGTQDIFQTTAFDEDDEENNLLGTVRGRVGVAFDRVLVYGTGGLALTSSENTEAFVGFGRGAGITSPARPFVFAFSEDGGNSDDDDDIALGFAAGGGIEVAVTDNFIVGAEAIYFNVDNDDDDDNTLRCDPNLSAAGCGGLATQTISVSDDSGFEGVIGRVRGSYKFNFGG